MSAENKNIVIVKRLAGGGGKGSFRDFRPLSPETADEAGKKLAEIFDELGGPALLKKSRDVYIKPNVVGANAYVFTRPEVVEAAVRYWYQAGARRVFIFENSTQATYTRLVFELAGYNALCKRSGAVPIYLDEDAEVEYEFAGKRPVAEDPMGYELTRFSMPRTVHEKLILGRDDNLYVSMPKLKTHSMSVVTLGMKNQWGFPIHRHRSPDHNYNLHSKIVDVLAHVRPDVTVIEGIEGTIHGHYPALALADQCVKPFRVLIGGKNVVAVDMVGARVFGKTIADVPHLAIAIERGLGDGFKSERDVTITGDCVSYDALDLLNEWEEYGGQYPDDLYPQFPEGITVIKGRERACREGCVNNPLNNLQLMGLDHVGRGGRVEEWTMMMGKGFDPDEVDKVQGPVFIVGPCAVKEIGPKLISRLGKNKVYVSNECNDLAAVVEAMCHLMKISPFKLAPPINPVKGAVLIARAMLNKSSGRMTNPFANLIKLR